MDWVIPIIVALTALITAFGTLVTVVWRIADLRREVAELKAVLRSHGIWYELGNGGKPTRSMRTSGRSARKTQRKRSSPPPQER